MLGDYIKDPADLWRRKCAQVIDQVGIINAGTSTGSADAYVLDLEAVNGVKPPVRLLDKQRIYFTPNFTNTGPNPTITVSSAIGSKTIKASDATSAIAASEIVINKPTELEYDEANDVLKLLNPDLGVWAGNSIILPPGAIQMYGAASAPSGWLLCDGSAVSRTTYAALFAIISTTYGIGNGSTTFNLPDLRQRFPLGKAASGTGSTLGGTGGNIDHTHTVPAHYHGMGTGANLAISSSGAHQHFVVNPDSGSSATSASNYITDSANFVTDFSYTLRASATVASMGLTSSSSHTHTSGNFTGSIGLVTGGVNGNAAMTSGTGNPPFVTVNFIIKF
jgi:microcystin-dependent protein